MDSSPKQPPTPLKFFDEASVLIITRGPESREKRFALWVDLNFNDAEDFDAWFKNDSGAYDKQKLEVWLDYYFPFLIRASRLMTLEEALRMDPDTAYCDARSFLKERDRLDPEKRLKHPTMDSSRKHPPPPVNFPDEAGVLVITRGPESRDKRFALWVDLNFHDSRDFHTWFKNDSGEYNKKNLEIWLDHYHPFFLRKPRIITLTEALRLNRDEVYHDARSYLKEEDHLAEEKRIKFEDIVKHLMHPWVHRRLNSG